MPFGKKKSYQLTGKSEKKNSISVGKYTKKTEKSITPSSNQSSANIKFQKKLKKAKNFKKCFKKSKFL